MAFFGWCCATALSGAVALSNLEQVTQVVFTAGAVLLDPCASAADMA
jgi:hypothetical protein